MDWLIKAIDEGRAVQREYERAHQRIHESHASGGDAVASTVERIKGLTNPHKLVGTHYAAKDHGMGDAAALASSQLKRMHKRTVDSFPAPSRKVKPVDVGSSAGKKLPKAPLPQKGQGREDYVRTVFHHYRNMGRPHNQAWAIAHSMADRHHVQKSMEEVMARYDLVSPRPLRPAQQDRTLFPMREEQARFAVREGGVAPFTRKGMQAGALPGTRAPRAPLPALVLNKAFVMVMPAKTSHSSLQPQPAKGVSYPTQVVALEWLARASGRE